jgi:hypothetical protein
VADIVGCYGAGAIAEPVTYELQYGLYQNIVRAETRRSRGVLVALNVALGEPDAGYFAAMSDNLAEAAALQERFRMAAATANMEAGA